MQIKPVYCAGVTPAMNYARKKLEQYGIHLLDHPDWNTGHLLLDVPSFRAGSPFTNQKDLDTLLSALPKDITIWGGSLDHPCLETYHKVDFLMDETYLVKNAAITADCTLQVAAPLLKTTWPDTPTLIIGWGRIGKCLGDLLKSLGCPVTFAVRQVSQLEKLRVLGFSSVTIKEIPRCISQFRLICNTVPSPVLSEKDVKNSGECIKIDLASKRGIAGDDVVWARGLPGIYAPESSGNLIANTFISKVKEVNP